MYNSFQIFGCKSRQFGAFSLTTNVKARLFTEYDNKGYSRSRKPPPHVTAYLGSGPKNIAAAAHCFLCNDFTMLTGEHAPRMAAHINCIIRMGADKRELRSSSADICYEGFHGLRMLLPCDRSEAVTNADDNYGLTKLMESCAYQVPRRTFSCAYG